MKIKNISRFLITFMLVGSSMHVNAFETDKDTDKTIANEEENYRITLNVKASESEEVVTPSDTILILDTSGSMKDGQDQYIEFKGNIHEIDYITRLIYALKDGNYYRIVDEVMDPTTEIAISEINDKTTYRELIKGTEKLSSMKNAVKQFIDLVEETNSENRIAIVDFGSEVKMKTSTNFLLAGDSSLKTMIDNMKADGATRIDLGFKQAMEYPFNATIKNVILFTDGVPTKFSAFDKDVAASAVSYAKRLTADNVNVFSIGVKVEDKDGNVDKFMKDVASKDDYSYTIEKMDELDAILEEVYTNTKDQVYRKVVDVLSDEVEVIENSIQNGGIYDETTRTITWTNAEVSQGWTTSFLVQLSEKAPKEGTFPSNKETSGVYDDKDHFIPFPIPEITLEKKDPQDPEPTEPQEPSEPTEPTTPTIPTKPSKPKPPIPSKPEVPTPEPPKVPTIPVQPQQPLPPVKPTVPGLVDTGLTYGIYPGLAILAFTGLLLAKRKK